MIAHYMFEYALKGTFNPFPALVCTRVTRVPGGRVAPPTAPDDTFTLGKSGRTTSYKYKEQLFRGRRPNYVARSRALVHPVSVGLALNVRGRPSTRPISTGSPADVRRASWWSTGTIRMVSEPFACVPRLGGYLAIRRHHPASEAGRPVSKHDNKGGVLQKRWRAVVTYCYVSIGFGSGHSAHPRASRFKCSQYLPHPARRPESGGQPTPYGHGVKFGRLD